MAGAGGLAGAPEALLDSIGDLPASTGFLVALSGGADSAVAAWALVSNAGAAAVRGLYVDHGLPDSPALAEAAAKVAAQLGIELTCATIDVPAGANWEARAREARRSALENMAQPQEVIVTGHHADDQAETVLANLLRGAGARGLGAMQRRSGTWWRPLLDETSSSVRSVADALSLPYLDDPANDDLATLRNRLRREVVPVLDRMSPGVATRLVRTANHLREDDAVLEGHIASLPLARTDGAWHVPTALLRTIARPLARRLLRRVAMRARPPYPPSSAEIVRLERVAAGEVARAEITGGLVAELEGPYLSLYVNPELSPAPASTTLPLPGRVSWGAWEISGRLTSVRPLSFGRRVGVLAAGVVTGPLQIRAALPGDVIDLKQGSKSIGTALAEAGVPGRLRATWPVVTLDGKIAWLVGVRVADSCRPDSTTSRYVELGTMAPWKT